MPPPTPGRTALTPSRGVRLGLAFFIVSVPIIGWAVELGVALTPAHLAGLVLMALAAGIWWRHRLPIPVDAAVLSIAGFVLVAAVTVVAVQFEPEIRFYGESSHAKPIKQFVGLGFGVAVFISLYSLLRWCGLGQSALRWHFWTTTVVAALAMVQYAIAVVDINSPLANFPVQNSTLGGVRGLSLMYGFPRVSLTMVEPSNLAIYLLTGWAFWLYSLDRPIFTSRRGKTLFTWAGVLLGLAVVVTGSRLAYVVFAALLLGALALRPRRLLRAGLVGLSLVVGFLLAGPRQGQRVVATLVPELPQAGASSAETASAPGLPGAPAAGTVDNAAATVERAVRKQDISVQHRSASYLVAMRVIRERPFFGGGFGTSGFYMERYWPSTFATGYVRTATPTMLSQYAAVAAETGLFGLICLAVFAVALLRRLARLAYRTPENSGLAWGLVGAVGAYALGGAATPLVVYQILLGWLLLAIALTTEPEPSVQAVAADASADLSLKNRPSIWSMRPDRESMNPGRSA